MKMLIDAGHTDIADKLDANASARDWLRNWGKLVYDPSVHGRDRNRRRAAAQIVRAIRRGTKVVDAVRAGAWIGATMKSN
jgi:hypothetical protein